MYIVTTSICIYMYIFIYSDHQYIAQTSYQYMPTSTQPYTITLTPLSADTSNCPMDIMVTSAPGVPSVTPRRWNSTSSSTLVITSVDSDINTVFTVVISTRPPSSPISGNSNNPRWVEVLQYTYNSLLSSLKIHWLLLLCHY